MVAVLIDLRSRPKRVKLGKHLMESLALHVETMIASGFSRAAS
jgi:hypothetical protein